jgi:hypothetical protein
MPFFKISDPLKAPMSPKATRLSNWKMAIECELFMIILIREGVKRVEIRPRGAEAAGGLQMGCREALARHSMVL